MNDQFEQYAKLREVFESVTKVEKQFRLLNQESAVAKIGEKFRLLNQESAIAKIGEQPKQLLAAMSIPNVLSSKLLEQIKIDQQRFYENFSKQTTIWQKLTQPSQDIVKLSGLAEIRVASFAWDSSITRLISQLQEVNLFVRKPDLAVRFLEPTKVYTDFVERTAQRIQQSTNVKLVNALQTSLYLAEVQLLATTDALSTIARVPEDDELASPARELLLPDIQQEELIAAIEIADEDGTSLVNHSPSATIANQARLVLQLITQCNEAVKITEQPEIFKPTTKLMEAFADLPWLIANDKRTFADIIDCLYFIFYEGAGTDKLRFLIPQGGVLQPNDCDLIWCIKHLRNKWLRHDPDRGKEADIKKSRKELLAKFNWLGLKHAPINEQHFRHLHNRLLEEAGAFLRKILERLINSQ